MITPSFAPTATERILPAMALDFTTATLDSRVTITRALNTATRVNSSGYIETVNADLPRFDYNPVTLACKGLLIEEARTNIAPYSQDATNSGGWNVPQQNASVVADATTAPDNTATADFLEEDSATSEHGTAKIGQSVTSGTTYTFSMFIKSTNRSLRFLLPGAAFGTDQVVKYDPTTGTATLIAGTPTYSMTAYANSWYRCVITAAATATTGGNVQLRLMNGNNTNYTGDNTSGVYIWGAQWETGAFPTSYIPNLAAGSTTRNGDAVAMTGTNFSNWYNATQGTFAITWNTPSSLIDCVPFTTNDGTDNNRIGCDATATGFGRIIVTDTGSTQAFGGTGGMTAGKNTFCVGYKANDFGISKNGGSATTDTSGTVPTVTQLQIGRRLTSLYINGTVAKLNYWKQKVTTAEIQAFSKG